MGHHCVHVRSSTEGQLRLGPIIDAIPVYPQSQHSTVSTTSHLLTNNTTVTMVRLSKFSYIGKSLISSKAEVEVLSLNPENKPHINDFKDEKDQEIGHFQFTVQVGLLRPT